MINLIAARHALDLLARHPRAKGLELRECIEAIASVSFQEHHEAWRKHERVLPRWAAAFTVLNPDVCPEHNHQSG